MIAIYPAAFAATVLLMGTGPSPAMAGIHETDEAKSKSSAEQLMPAAQDPQVARQATADPDACINAPASDTAAALVGKADARQEALPPSITPYMRVAIAAHCAWARPGSRLGGYTRLSVRYEPPAGSSERLYDSERRAWPVRWLMGKSIARVLTIKASLARPKVAMTTSIASVGHVSNDKDGEAWTTELNPRRMLTPYFRIDSESALNLEFTLNVSSTYDASLAKNGLALVRRATELVAPSATLLTSLNEERFGQASQFVDSTIASLLRESIVERSVNDYVIKDWTGQKLAEIEVKAPIGNEVTPSAKSRDRHLQSLGKWIVYADRPILSVFSDVEIFEPVPLKGTKAPATAATAAKQEQQPCVDFAASSAEHQACLDFAKLQPSAILNFQVDSGVSVNQALSSDDSVISARDALMKAGDGDPTKAAAQDLCLVVVDKADKLGFNRFDTAAILWAYTRQGFDAKRRTVLQDATTCLPLTLAYAMGLRRAAY